MMIKTKLNPPGQQDQLFTTSVPLAELKSDGVIRIVENGNHADAIAGEAFPETLCEMEAPVPFKFYDYLNIEDFIWDTEERCLHLSIYATFLEEQKGLTLKAYFKNKETGECIGEVDFPKASNVVRHDTHQYIETALDPKRLSVSVIAEIEHKNGTSTKLVASKQNCASCDSNVTLSPVYEHIYPKKEPVTVIFGQFNNKDRKPTTYTHDPNYIVISLFREPEVSGDSDYVCNYGHGSKGRAMLGIPAKGIISLGRSVKITSTALTNPYATIERFGAGGKATTTTNFKNPIIDKGKLQYEIETNWEYEIDQEGDLKPYYYNYELSFNFDYQLPASAETQTMNFKVTSKNGSAIRNGSQIIERILPLKIMWGCLAEDTLVLTDMGLKKIQDIKIGDRVADGNPGAFVTVRNVWKGTGKEESLIKIIYGKAQIKLTGSHPLCVEENEKVIFKRAASIIKGDILVGQNSGRYMVDDVCTVPYDSNVYNLSLEGDSHRFIAENITVGDMDAQNSTI